MFCNIGQESSLWLPRSLPNKRGSQAQNDYFEGKLLLTTENIFFQIFLIKISFPSLFWIFQSQKSFFFAVLNKRFLILLKQSF